MKFKVNSAMSLDDGKYNGIIQEIKYRESPYEYADIFIAVQGGQTGQIIKVGYPSYLSPTSGLGKLLERMGSKLEIGKEIDPEAALIGKAVSFLVVNEVSKKDGNTYSKVVSDSVKSAHTNKQEKFK